MEDRRDLDPAPSARCPAAAAAAPPEAGLGGPGASGDPARRDTEARRHRLDDLFPGSGAVGRAWAAYTGGGDPSLPAAADASCKARAARRVRPRAMCCFRPGRTRRLRRRVTRKAQIWADPSSTSAVRRVVQAAGNTSGTAYACAVCPAGYPHRAGDGLRPVRAGSRLPLGLWPMPAARE